MVGNDIACDILIRHFRRLGLSVDAVNNEGFTALLSAAKHGNVTCAQILIGHGKASIRFRDKKQGLSVEEWLQKTGFTLQDVTPFICDGKGRSTFVKFGNVANICSGNKRLGQMAKQPSREFEYPISSLNFEDEEGYISDPHGTGGFYSTDDWYKDQDDDTRLFPFQKPNMKNEETQTSDDDFEAAQGKWQNRTELDAKRRQGNSDKRLSLPDIAGSGKGAVGKGSVGKDRKPLLQALPEVLIANVDLGNGRRKNIKLRSDPQRNKFYWKPCLDDDEDDNLTNIMGDLNVDPAQTSDSEESTMF